MKDLFCFVSGLSWACFLFSAVFRLQTRLKNGIPFWLAVVLLIILLLGLGLIECLPRI